MGKQKGRDFGLHVYPCVRIAADLGMSEIPVGAQSTRTLMGKAGKAGIRAFLAKTHASADERERATDAYVSSMAALCVLSYVMGEHKEDQVTILKDGRVFQMGLDYGHLKRGPFRMTEAYWDPIGAPSSPEGENFVALAQKAFQILRRNSGLLVSVFTSMVGGSKRVIKFVRDRLHLDGSDAEAAAAFKKAVF